MMMGRAEGQNEQWKWLYANGLHSKLCSRHQGNAMTEQLDLARDEVLEVFDKEVVRTVFVDSKMKLLQLVWLEQLWLKF